MKILSPAGNFESLKAAIYNGADEVYLGINDFNARNNIDGFTLDNLQDAVDFAHVFGIKVHLAINILFSDDELQSALDTVIAAYNLGVDAFIVQDLGLIKIISENYPQIEIHASTQMGLHNLEGVEFARKFGIKRVVLSRETPLCEIKRIRENSDVEIEYFAQGALCVGFSGNCYLSSYMFGASGNRGRCKQLCRLPFSLEKDGKTLKHGYLISAKEFNMIERLSDLKDAGVDALKIEGRARRPYYVGAITREYKRALSGKKVDASAIELAFNRGYTAGYFDGNGNIISELQNHIGIPVGKVEKVNVGKTFSEVFFESNRPLYKKSTFKVFEGGREKSVITAHDLTLTANKYRLTTTQKISVGDRLNLINDAFEEEKILNTIKKRPIKIRLSIVADKAIRATFILDGKEYQVIGENLQKAISQPLKKKDFEDNFNKSEYFSTEIEFDAFEDVFLQKSKLNEFRRAVLARAYGALTQKFKRNLEKIKIDTHKKIKPFTDFQTIYSVEEEFIAKNIVFFPEIYDEKIVAAFKEKCERLNKCAYLDTPNFALKEDIIILKNIIKKTGVNIVANNYYALSLDAKKIIGGGLNVYNSIAADYYGLPIIAAESGVIEKTDFPAMTFRHCPMKTHLGADCSACPFEDGFSYVMENGKRLKLKRKKITSCTFYLHI